MSQKSQFSPEISSYPSSPTSYTRAPPKPSTAQRATSSAHQGLNILILFIGLTIVATQAAAVAVFRQTYNPASLRVLALWPAKFDLGPSIAVLVAGSVVVIGSAAVLVVSKVPSVSAFPFPCVWIRQSRGIGKKKKEKEMGKVTKLDRVMCHVEHR